MLALGRVGVVSLWILVVCSLMHCMHSVNMKGLTGHGALCVVSCVAALYLLYKMVRHGVHEEMSLDETCVLALWVVVLTTLLQCYARMSMKNMMHHHILCVVNCLAGLYLLYELLVNAGL